MEDKPLTFEDHLRVRLEQLRGITDPDVIAEFAPETHYTLSFKINLDLHRKLEHVAAVGGYSKSELVRMILTEPVNRAYEMVEKFEKEIE